MFNNLTYLGTAGPDWDANPLARTGTFTSAGRHWKVTCSAGRRDRAAHLPRVRLGQPRDADAHLERVPRTAR